MNGTYWPPNAFPVFFGCVEIRAIEPIFISQRIKAGKSGIEFQYKRMIVLRAEIEKKEIAKNWKARFSISKFPILERSLLLRMNHGTKIWTGKV